MEFGDEGGCDVKEFVILVSELLVDDGVGYVVVDFLMKESEEEVVGVGKGKNVEVMGVLDVDDLVGDMVGRL